MSSKRILRHLDEMARRNPAIQRDITMIKNEIESRDDVIKSWFGATKIAKDEVLPALLSGMDGYLRVSKNGGMPTKDAEMVKGVFAHFMEINGKFILAHSLKDHHDKGH